LTIAAVLALSLLSQVPDAAPTKLPPRVTDLIFARAQEDWLYRTRRFHDLDHVLPTRDARLVRRLGCARWECREDAEADLATQGDKAARAILWGCKVRDPEIRDRCARLWDRLFRCERCNGAGQIKTRTEWGDDWWSGCERCGGSGDFRYEMRWTLDGYRPVEREAY
jgi:hypothetical protein